jgi:hypothetical protein
METCGHRGKFGKLAFDSKCDIRFSMRHLDFWGSFIDLVGLVVLLSYDVPFLQNVLLRLPTLRRRHDFLNELKTRSKPSADLAESFQTFAMKTLTGSDVPSFMRLYPDRDRRSAVPKSLSIFAHYENRLRFPDPWIYPSLDPAGNSQLASPLSLPSLFTNEENDIRKIVYSVGFVLMFLGSVMFLIHAAH